VATGAEVSRGQAIGRTGTSGLAGGDHLHFDVLVSGQQVNPIEWWDPNWIRNNVSDKLALAGLTVR
jgi:murein DD-endopeptidase MepM/ murein hydrolase activator NlpD